MLRCHDTYVADAAIAIWHIPHLPGKGIVRSKFTVLGITVQYSPSMYCLVETQIKGVLKKSDTNKVLMKLLCVISWSWIGKNVLLGLILVKMEGGVKVSQQVIKNCGLFS